MGMHEGYPSDGRSITVKHLPPAYGSLCLCLTGRSASIVLGPMGGSRGVGTGAEAMPLRESKRGTDPCHTSIMGGPHSPGFSGGLWASDGESDSHRAFLFR